MALRQPYTLNVFGKNVVFESAYFKIETIQGNRDLMTFDLIVFSDSSKTEKVETINYSFVPSLGSPNFIIQGYEYLKNLPEYAYAVDV